MLATLKFRCSLIIQLQPALHYPRKIHYTRVVVSNLFVLATRMLPDGDLFRASLPDVDSCGLGDARWAKASLAALV